MTLSPERRAEMRTSVGGSDIAALVGESPWSTPRSVWLAKADLVEDVQSEALYWGSALEIAILNRYREGMPAGVTVRHNTQCVYHAEYPWARATPDGIAADGDTFWGVEVKTCNAFASRSWDDGVPPWYVMQVQWSMFVLDVQRWDVAVLIGGSDYREFTLERDDEQIRHLFTAAEKFYREHMLADVCPDPSTPAEWSKTPARDETILWANADQEDVALEYLNIIDDIKHETQQAESWKAELQAAIGEHAGLEGPGFKITWRASGKGRRFVAKRKEQ